MNGTTALVLMRRTKRNGVEIELLKVRESEEEGGGHHVKYWYCSSYGIQLINPEENVGNPGNGSKWRCGIQVVDR